MKFLTAADLKALSETNSDTLAVEVQATQIKLRLLKVVALSNFKTLASAGRAGKGSAFDAARKELTVQLRRASDMTPGTTKIGFNGDEEISGFRLDGQFYEASPEAVAAVVAIYPFDNFDGLVKVAKRLKGGKAKTFNSTKDAFAARKPHTPAQDMDMDMPMWDPIRRECYDGEIETRDGGRPI